MRKTELMFAFLVWIGQAQAARADAIPWVASPNNWINSPYNFENSPNNYANSPKNFKNAEGTRGRLNIVNVLGVVTGYAIIRKDGGINYFDSSGARIGYSVDGGKTQYDPNGEPTTFTIEVED